MAATGRINREECRRLRRDGALIRQLAARYGVSLPAITYVCRGVVPRPGTLAANPAKRRPGGPAISAAILAVAQRAIDGGATVTAAAKTAGCCIDTLQNAHNRGDIDISRAGRGARGRSSAEARAMPSRYANVPDWACAAGLADDYADLAADLGVDHAARQCRRLKAEAMRPC